MPQIGPAPPRLTAEGLPGQSGGLVFLTPTLEPGVEGDGVEELPVDDGEASAGEPPVRLPGEGTAEGAAGEDGVGGGLGEAVDVPVRDGPGGAGGDGVDGQGDGVAPDVGVGQDDDGGVGPGETVSDGGGLDPRPVGCPAFDDRPVGVGGGPPVSEVGPGVGPVLVGVSPRDDDRNLRAQ